MTATPWPLDCHLELRDGLLAAYGAPTRGYHDLRHLAEVLEHTAELLADEPGDPVAVGLGAWYHDAVYEGAHDDEERSALLAEQQLAGAGVARGLVVEVARLVRLTATHAPALADHNGRVLCDADLAILAAEPERYADYVAGVRTDFAHLPDADFRSGRAAVLRDLLGRPALFHTETARTRWEDLARTNIAKELAGLDA
jgi:predicted metal-dependent HD superfamily phosphohydrolase